MTDAPEYRYCCECESRLVLNDIVIERHYQIAKGFDALRDDERDSAELAQVASKLLILYLQEFDDKPCHIKAGWVGQLVDKIAAKHTPREMLIKAAALIIAEVERQDRFYRV